MNKDQIEKIKEWLVIAKIKSLVVFNAILSFFGILNFIIIGGAVTIGLFTSLLIFAFNISLILKIVFIVLSIVLSIAMITSNVDLDKEPRAYRQSALFIVLTLFVIEGCLFLVSDYEQITPITVVVTNKEYALKNRTGKVIRGYSVPYKLVSYYGPDNDLIESKIIEKEDEPQLPMLASVTGLKKYTEYVPFVMYKKRKEYVRNDKTEG